MSAQANIVAFDGAATPVSHTLVPADASRDASSGELIAEWREALTTVPVYAQVRAKTTCKRLASGVYRVATIVEVPVMESVSGQNAAGYTAAPKVAYTNTVQVVGYFHERSTVAERRLARQLAVNIAGSVSTSVTPVTTGVVPELMDQLISAS